MVDAHGSLVRSLKCAWCRVGITEHHGIPAACYTEEPENPHSRIGLLHFDSVWHRNNMWCTEYLCFTRSEFTFLLVK